MFKKNCVSRCNVVINFFENAYRINVSEEPCDDCQSAILDVSFNKVCATYYVDFGSLRDDLKP